MNESKNQSPRKAVILTADQFEDMEVYYPLFRLQEAGWEVSVAAPDLETISGKHGYKLKPDVTFDGAKADDYELMILPGGSANGAPSTVRNSTNAQEIAKSFFHNNKPVAAICHGPYTLISAGLVKDRHLTSYLRDGVPEEIQQNGGIWEDREVVVDGNLITSRSPKDLPAFMREVMRMTQK